MAALSFAETLGFAEIEAQQVELLPARTVLSTVGGGYYGGYGDDGGPGGDGGYGGQGGQAYGGDGGTADATVAHNVNNGFIQINVAVAEANGGHGYANGGDGGTGGYGGEGGANSTGFYGK